MKLGGVVRHHAVVLVQVASAVAFDVSASWEEGHVRGYSAVLSVAGRVGLYGRCFVVARRL